MLSSRCVGRLRAEPRCRLLKCRAESLPSSQRFSVLWASRADYQSDGTTVYLDSALDRLLVAFLTRRLQAQLGEAPSEAPADYAAFVDVAARISRGRTPAETHTFVLSALTSLLPAWLWSALRRLVSVLTWLRFPVASALAVAAVPFAGWLVGPARVERRAPPGVPSALDSAAPLSTTVLRRCRYLEAAGCKSACINVCKVPTQNFFADVLGVPLTMDPDFESLGCELRFGQPPPPLHEDAAMRGACFASCTLAMQKGPTDADAGLGCSPGPRPIGS
jgi:hypothetical protein